jgi:hypothetical protein
MRTPAGGIRHEGATSQPTFDAGEVSRSAASADRVTSYNLGCGVSLIPPRSRRNREVIKDGEDGLALILLFL